MRTSPIKQLFNDQLVSNSVFILGGICSGYLYRIYSKINISYNNFEMLINLSNLLHGDLNTAIFILL